MKTRSTEPAIAIGRGRLSKANVLCVTRKGADFAALTPAVEKFFQAVKRGTLFLDEHRPLKREWREVVGLTCNRHWDLYANV